MRDIADILARRGSGTAQIRPCHAQTPATCRQQPAKHAKRGSFARAIGTKQAKNFAALNLEADMIDGNKVLEAANQIMNLNHGRIGRSGDWEIRRKGDREIESRRRPGQQLFVSFSPCLHVYHLIARAPLSRSLLLSQSLYAVFFSPTLLACFEQHHEAVFEARFNESSG